MSGQTYKQLESKLMSDIEKDLKGLTSWIQKNQDVAEKAPQILGILQSGYKVASDASELMKKYSGNYGKMDPIETANIIIVSRGLENGYRMLEDLMEKGGYKEIRSTQEKVYKAVSTMKKPMEKAMKDLERYLKKNPDDGKKIIEAYGEQVKQQSGALDDQKKGLLESYKIVEGAIRPYLPKK